MDALTTADMLLFEDFGLDRGGLSRRDQSGTFVPVSIGSRALEILAVLVARPGVLVTREEIIKEVWPGTIVEYSNLPVQIAALRRVLDEGRAEGSCIQTVAGRGYRFALPVTRLEPFAPPASGHRSGNGAGGAIAEPKPPTPSGSRNTTPIIPPRDRKWFWCGGLALVAGALCLLPVLVTTLNRHLPLLRALGPAPRLSIVVLPFTNLSGDRDEQNLANGLTEDLTTELSMIPDIRVTSSNTALTYGNQLVETKRIGRDLSVRYALEGSVQRSGNRVRVNAELIDTEKDTQLWAERFDRDADDVFSLQNEITSRIAIALNLELVAAEAARPTKNPDTLDYILRGRAARFKPVSRRGYAEAISLFEHALVLDPQSVEAQSLLAGALAGRVLDQMSDAVAADVARADELAGQALAASSRSPLAHYAKGQVLRAQRRWAEALPEYETAFASDRNWLSALNGIAYCKFYTGSLDEVIPLMEQAIRLSPRDPQIGLFYHQIGRVHVLQSRVELAIPWLERARNAVPEATYVRDMLTSAYALKGDSQRAVAEMRRLRVSSPTIARTKVNAYLGVPEVQALYEATFFKGLRKAGVPEE
jgi:adenylate cyclase